MAIDPFDLAALLELLFARRLIVPIVVGIAIACGFYYLSDQDPSAAAVALGIGIAGFVVGLIWHIAGGSKSGPA